MPKGKGKKSETGGEQQLWLAPAPAERAEQPPGLEYRPAVFFQCLLEFRDVRAEVIHSEERIYTAWLPNSDDDDLAVDWSKPAVGDLDPNHWEESPPPSISSSRQTLKLDGKRMNAVEADLIDHLVHHEELLLYYNPYSKLYSKLGESRDELLARVREETSNRLEPELRELARRLQRQLDQVRQSPLPNDLPEPLLEELDAIRRHMISAVESRMDSLIMGHSETQPDRLPSNRVEVHAPDEIREVREELNRIEAEILNDFNALLSDYTTKVSDCEEYRIKLQPTNIKVIRRALVWVPTSV
jgi:hypothetical protein